MTLDNSLNQRDYKNMIQQWDDAGSSRFVKLRNNGNHESRAALRPWLHRGGQAAATRALSGVDISKAVFNVIKQMAISLGNSVHDARRAKKKTLRVLASELGISAALLSLIEQGKHVPPKELIVRLAQHLGEDPDQWCAAAGQVTPDAEKRLAKLAQEDPKFFRTMLSRHKR